MGVFVLFLYFIYINENIAKASTERRFPVSSADTYHYPIRKHTEDYYDPFLQDIYSEIPEYKKELLCKLYKDDDFNESENLYSEIPLQLREYNEYISLPRNIDHSREDHYQSGRKYNEVYPQREYYCKEVENVETPKWSYRDDDLRKWTKDMEHFSKEKGLQSDPNKFNLENKYARKHFEKYEKPKSIEYRISYPEYDDPSFMMIPRESGGEDTIHTQNFPREYKYEYPIKYSEVLEKNPLENPYKKFANQKLDTYCLANYKDQVDELKAKNNLKHSLTTSASAVEKRLLASHIKKTFEKVKENEDVENKLRDFDAINNSIIDTQKITEPHKTVKMSSRSTPAQHHLTSYQNPNTNPSELQRPFDTSPLSKMPSSDKYRSQSLYEICNPHTYQLNKAINHESCGHSTNMEEVSHKFLSPSIPTGPNHGLPSSYQSTNQLKQVEVTQQDPLQSNELVSKTSAFDVNLKVTNDCVQPIDSNNVAEKKERKNIFPTNKAPLSNYYIKDYAPLNIDPPDKLSNIKSPNIYNENKSNNYKINVETIPSNLVKYKPSFKNELNIISPEYKTTITQTPHYAIEKGNLTSSNIKRDNMKKDTSYGILYKTPEVNYSPTESTIVNSDVITKKDQNNCIKCYSLSQGPAIVKPIDQNFNGDGKIYNAPSVPPNSFQAPVPQQSGINVKQTYNTTPLFSTTPYSIQIPSNSFYETNKPKITILNPTSATQKTPPVLQKPTAYYIPTYQQIGPAINAPKIEVLSNNYTKLTPKVEVLYQNYTKLNPVKSPNAQVKILPQPNYPVAPNVNQYNSLLTTSLNKIASVIVSNLLSNLNNDTSNTTSLLQDSNASNSPISPEIKTFEVTHPCIQSPRNLPETVIKSTKKNSVNTTNKSSKPYVSTITINVLPPAQPKSNDIIIVV